MGWMEILLSGATTLLFALKGIGWMIEGELAAMTIFGKAVRGKNKKIIVYKPKFRLLIPLVQKLKKAHVRLDYVELGGLCVIMKNGLTYFYSAYAEYKVSPKPDDLEKNLFNVKDPKALIKLKLSSSTRSLLAGSNTEDMGVEITEKLSEALKTYLKDEIGVELISCGITSITESEQAQQVKVTMAKIEYAKKLYGTEDIKKIPQALIDASFGIMQVNSHGYSYEHEELSEEEKNEERTFSITREKESNAA